MPSERPTGQRILITGGAGFVGSHLADALVTENDVVVLDNLRSGSREHVPTGAEFVEGSVTDTALLDDLTADVDLVFHEAAIVSVAQSVEAPVETHAVNGDATLHLLDLARQHDFRVVLASSAAIYGEPTTTPIPETHRKQPESPYGLDKLTNDEYARLFADLYDVETVALRYFNIYGPRQTGGDYGGVVSIFRDLALAGDDLTVHGTGEQTRDFVHVDDVVQANLRAAVTEHTGEAFNVGTGSSVSIRELAETIRDVADSESEIIHVDAREGDIEESIADISKAKEKLGFEPDVSLEDGLERLLREA